MPMGHDKHRENHLFFFPLKAKYFCQRSKYRENVKQRLIQNMLQILRHQRFEGCCAVFTQIPNIYLPLQSTISVLYRKETDGWPICLHRRPDPRFFNCIFFPVLKKTKHTVTQYKFVRNKFKLSHVPTKTILQRNTMHLSLKCLSGGIHSLLEFHTF